MPLHHRQTQCIVKVNNHIKKENKKNCFTMNEGVFPTRVEGVGNKLYVSFSLTETEQ